MDSTSCSSADLAAIYGAYIACLNARDWSALDRFVTADVTHNGRLLGVEGYRAMLVSDCEAIPDLRFVVEATVSQPPRIACRLHFDVKPKGRFLNLDIDGRRVSFHEHVFYEFRADRICAVHSVLNKLAIEAQLQEHRTRGPSADQGA